MFERLGVIPKICALIFSTSVVVVLTAFGLVEDTLFFHSDLRSAFVFMTALGCFVFAVLALICAAATLAFARLRKLMVANLGRFLAALLLADLLYFLLTWIDAEFRILGAIRRHDAEFLFFVLWLMLLGQAWFLIPRLPGHEEIVERTSVVAAIAAPLVLAAFAGFLVFGGAAGASVSGQDAEAGPRHAVLVVLDGWPAQYMRAFNPEARQKPFDAFLEQALVFRHVRTNSAWTNAYFGTIYNGSLDLTFVPLGLARPLEPQPDRTNRNLLSLLQGQGVKTRIMTFHRNGLPEASASLVSDYLGLRSAFLTFEHIPVLEALRLDYNLVIPVRGARSIWGDQRKALVRRLIGSKDRDYQNILSELLLPEMQRIQQAARRSFTVFHVDWKLGSDARAAAWDEDVPDGAEAEIVRRAKANNYRYEPADEWYAERMRRDLDLSVESVGAKIAAFVDAAKKRGVLRDTLLVFTADHGSIYRRGRLWYSFHADEEVLRVPYFMLGAGRSGVDDRSFESIDIPQTLIEYFGGNQRLHPRARSMLRAGKKPFTASVTRPGHLSREWFISLYKSGRKYLFNVHPKGNGRSLQQRIERFRTITVAEGPEVVARVLPELAQVLAEYRIDDEKVHPQFRQARLKALSVPAD